MLNHFEGVKLTLTSLKISLLEQLNSKIFASLSTSFYCLKIDRLIKRNGITSLKVSYLEHMNSKISASLLASFPCLNIARLIKRTG